MPNYLVTNCIDSSLTYIISAGTLTSGETISFYIGEDAVRCGTVVELSSLDHEGVYGGSYETCCDCYSGNSFITLEFSRCESPDSTFTVSLTGFCETYGSMPKLREVFQFSEGEVFFCGKLIDVATSMWGSEYFPEEGPFEDCTPCLRTITISAGTESKVCIICCECGPSGSTINLITPPHPQWTDGTGRPIILLDAIVLGGPNGLNS